ncbi:MAG: hypothetical protein PSX81_05195 [bacterium]|nr:hypothetical protein [bacterium]
MKKLVLKKCLIIVIVSLCSKLYGQTNVSMTSSRSITSCGNSVQIYDAANVLLATSVCLYSGSTANILCLTGVPSYVIIDECGTGCSFRVNFTGVPTSCGICTCNCSIGSPTVTANYTPPIGTPTCLNPYLLSVAIN